MSDCSCSRRSFIPGRPGPAGSTPAAGPRRAGSPGGTMPGRATTPLRARRSSHFAGKGEAGHPHLHERRRCSHIDNLRTPRAQAFFRRTTGKEIKAGPSPRSRKPARATRGSSSSAPSGPSSPAAKAATGRSARSSPRVPPQCAGRAGAESARCTPPIRTTSTPTLGIHTGVRSRSPRPSVGSLGELRAWARRTGTFPVVHGARALHGPYAGMQVWASDFLPARAPGHLGWSPGTEPIAEPSGRRAGGRPAARTSKLAAPWRERRNAETSRRARGRSAPQGPASSNPSKTAAGHAARGRPEAFRTCSKESDETHSPLRAQARPQNQRLPPGNVWVRARRLCERGGPASSS